jgi:tetratricopeptide (TPR) repeat protein
VAERADLLLELGSAEALVSGDAAVEHLREVRALTVDPVRRAQTARLLGNELFLLLRNEESDAVYTEALDELAGADPELERLLEAGLITNAIHVRRLYGGALQRLDRIRGHPRDATVGEKMLLSLLAFHEARAGVSAEVVVPLARLALADGTLIRAEVSGQAFVGPGMVLAMADLDEALAIYDDALAEAHRRGSIKAFGIAKTLRAQAFVLRGDLAEAEVEGREAFAASTAWGTTARTSVYLAAILADALIEQGKLDQAAAVLDRSSFGQSLPDDARLLFVLNIKARLRMLKGDLAGGLKETLEVGLLAEPLGGRNPAFLAWRSQAALALLHLGEQDEARRLVAEEFERARAWGCAPGARCRPARRRTGRGGRAWARASRGGGRGAHRLAGEARARQGAHRAGGDASTRQPPLRGARAAPASSRAGNDLRRDASRGARRD